MPSSKKERQFTFPSTRCIAMRNISPNQRNSTQRDFPLRIQREKLSWIDHTCHSVPVNAFAWDYVWGNCKSKSVSFWCCNATISHSAPSIWNRSWSSVPKHWYPHRSGGSHCSYRNGNDQFCGPSFTIDLQWVQIESTLYSTSTKEQFKSYHTRIY